MMKNISKAGGRFLSLPFLYLIGFSLFAFSLEARGSGEFSDIYQETLNHAFEEAAVKVESGDWNRTQAKSFLTELRVKYRVDYNDFAGKIDALLDEVADKKKDSRDVLSEFHRLQLNVLENRRIALQKAEQKALQDQEEQNRKDITQDDPNPLKDGSGPNSPEGDGSGVGKNK